MGQEMMLSRRSRFYTVYPEGLPSKALYTRSAIRAFAAQIVMGIRYLFPPHGARRVTAMSSEGAYKHAEMIERDIIAPHRKR
jgi:hypothetical protein